MSGLKKERKRKLLLILLPELGEKLLIWIGDEHWWTHLSAEESEGREVQDSSRGHESRYMKRLFYIAFVDVCWSNIK